MPSSRRDFTRGLGLVSITWLTGCTSDSQSSPTSTQTNTASSTSLDTETGVTPEPHSPELTVTNISGETHTIGVRLGEFESIPDGGGTPIESGTFILNDEFDLAPAEEVQLREYREPGEHYKFVLIIGGDVVMDEFLDAGEGLTIEIVNAKNVNIQRSFV